MLSGAGFEFGWFACGGGVGPLQGLTQLLPYVSLHRKCREYLRGRQQLYFLPDYIAGEL